MADLGWSPEDQRERVALTMAPHDLMEVLRRLRDEAQGALANTELRRAQEEDSCRAEGFQSARQACEAILDALADFEEGEINVSCA